MHCDDELKGDVSKISYDLNPFRGPQGTTSYFSFFQEWLG